MLNHFLNLKSWPIFFCLFPILIFTQIFVGIVRRGGNDVDAALTYIGFALLAQILIMIMYGIMSTIRYLRDRHFKTAIIYGVMSIVGFIFGSLMAYIKNKRLYAEHVNLKYSLRDVVLFVVALFVVPAITMLSLAIFNA